MNRTITEMLKTGEKVVQTVNGTSMWPMLRQNKDLVVLKRITEDMKINDVVLFKTASGKLVLHRIIGFKNGFYKMRGDNLAFAEKNVEPKDVIGILIGFYRGEKYIDVTKKSYKTYVLISRLTFFARFSFILALKLLRKLKK